jgi:hypothetical protein
MAMTLKDINDLADKLKASPDLPVEKRQLTKKEAVASLKPAIEDLRKRGYTLEQVAGLLRANGFDITFGSLRQYLADRQGGTSRRKKKAASTSPSSPPPVSATTPQKQPASASKAQEKADIKKSPGGGSFEVRPDTKDL